MASIAADERPDEHAALLARARDERDNGSLQEAERICRQALELCPTDAEAHRVLGTILDARTLSSVAVASFEASLELDPTNPKTHKQLAEALANQGRLEDALVANRRALGLRPGYVGALVHLAAVKRFDSPDDKDLGTLESRLNGGEPLDEAERALLLFALAKAHEDLGAYDRSFGYLCEANAIRRGMLSYDSAEALDFLERIKAVFSRETLESGAAAGSQSELPILIVGMPRSGTSLVEQILASHPEVYGGGELPDLGELARAVSVLTDGGLGFPEAAVDVQPALLRSLGEGYVQRLRDLAPDAARVTDKAPLNFRYLGFAHLALPRARVIHCVRDPVDTCFSCYSLNLPYQPYTFDLSELGGYYRAYAELMDHWRAVLPTGWMVDVRYEDVVANVEGQARRLVAHCGLEWSDACLRFNATDRTVRTASFAQVRSPIYGSSVGRWRRFESHLGPLLAALDEH